MRETPENLPKPFKKQSPIPENKTLTQTSKTCARFATNYSVATPQSSGSNPDRSPVAQWGKHAELSFLPAPRPLSPSLCLQGSAQNPCPARRRRKAPCGGEGVQKSQYWLKFASIQNPCPAGVDRKPRAAEMVFRNHNTGPNSHLYALYEQGVYALYAQGIY